MSPPYIFRIDEIAEADDAIQNVDGRGNWIPSIENNANVRIYGGVSGKWWYCNGQYLRQEPTLPTNAGHYRTWSLYYSAGFGIWVLRGDATNIAGGENWHPLRFDWDLTNYSSILTNAGMNNTLRVQRPDQQWPRILLPDIYHAPVTTPHQMYGGLKGELGIFLGLQALSTSRDYLPNVLPTLFHAGAWNEHMYSTTRVHQRGVVVSVYTAPPTMPNSSTANDLAQYEHGAFGLYYN